MNGTRDLDHISFSYSSDDDFLPHTITTHLKPQPSSPEEASPPATDTDKEKRKSDTLSLDQRRRRLCSIAPRTPLATPTTALATPSATPTSVIGHDEASRQPVSHDHSPSHKSSDTDSYKSHSRSRNSHSPSSHSKQLCRSPGWTGNQTLVEEWSGDGSSGSSSEAWQPRGASSEGQRKKRKKKRSAEPKKKKKMMRRDEGKKKTHLKPPHMKPPSHPSLDDQNSLRQERQEIGRELEEDKNRGMKELKLSDDEKVLEELKRKVQEQEKEKELTLHESLDKELEISSSSASATPSSSESEEGGVAAVGGVSPGGVVASKHRSKRQLLSSSDSESEDKQPPAKKTSHASMETGHDPTQRQIKSVQRGGSAGMKRETERSRGEVKRETERSRGEVKRETERGRGEVKRETERGRGEVKRETERGRGEVKRETERGRGEVKKETERSRGEVKRETERGRGEVKRETERGAPAAKKLRLVDIDFTGGRMKLPPQRPQAKHSPSKFRSHVNSRHGMGPGPERKVPSSASNVLKSKPLPQPHPPSKRPPHNRPSQKDAVLAAKFPHKRKLLDTPNKAHHMKSSKPSHRHC